MALLLFGLISFAQALPIEVQLQNALRNGTLLQDATFTGWSDDPSFRGTSDILWSCLVTIFASIYTSIHLDVPLKHISHSNRFRARVKWVFVALIAPELVLHAAFNQYYKAQQLVNILQAMETKDSENKTAPLHFYEKLAQLFSNHVLRYWQTSYHKQPTCNSNKYCLTYGFWVTMGGFVVDTTDIYSTRKRVALTPYGVVFLAKHGHFLEMPKDEIADRSKASAFAKALICIQILWMLFQTLVRVGAHYPLTLLEVHTTVHVVCALCIYALWWHKPLDVEEPSVIDSTNYKDIIACITMASLPMERSLWSQVKSVDTKSRGVHPDSEKDFLHGPEAHVLNLDPSKLPLQIDTKSVIAVDKFGERFEFDALNPDNLKISMDVVEHGSKDIPPVPSSVGEASDSDDSVVVPEQIYCCESGLYVPGFQINPDRRDIHRWKLYLRGLIRLGVVTSSIDRTLLYKFQGPEHCFVTEDITTGSILSHSSSSKTDKLHHYLMLDLMSFTAFWLPMLHGGVHFAARSQKFPSSYEALIWKISAVSTMIVCPVSFLCFSILYWCKKRGYTLGFHKQDQTHLETSPSADGHRGTISFSTRLVFCLGHFAVGIILVLGVIFYLSRIYLVVESFISLRDVPIGVFAATPWIQAFPHI